MKSLYQSLQQQKQQQHNQRMVSKQDTSTLAATKIMTTNHFARKPVPLATSAAEPRPITKSISFITAGMGGLLGWAIVHPFNTVAVRANLASASGQTFSLTGMVQQQGLLSVYDGLSAGLARQIFYASTRFGLFETFRDMLHEYRGKTDLASR